MWLGVKSLLRHLCVDLLTVQFHLRHDIETRRVTALRLAVPSLQFGGATIVTVLQNLQPALARVWAKRSPPLLRNPVVGETPDERQARWLIGADINSFHFNLFVQKAVQLFRGLQRLCLNWLSFTRVWVGTSLSLRVDFRMFISQVKLKIAEVVNYFYPVFVTPQWIAIPTWIIFCQLLVPLKLPLSLLLKFGEVLHQL